MTDKTMTLEQVRDYLRREAEWRRELKQMVEGCKIDAMADAINRHLSQTAERAEAVELEYPEFHAEGMGCGLEDRGITDRYEAMRYGFDEALDQMARIIESAGPLYTAPPPAAGVPDGFLDELSLVIEQHDGLKHYVDAMQQRADELMREWTNQFEV